MPPKDDLIRSNAALFESLLDSFPDVIWSVNRDGNIAYANATARELLGYTAEELLSMNITEVYAPELREKVKSGFNRLRQQGQLSKIESVVVDKEGNRIPVEIRSFAVYGKDQTFSRTFSILRDVSSIKQLQDNLMHAGWPRSASSPHRLSTISRIRSALSRCTATCCRRS